MIDLILAALLGADAPPPGLTASAGPGPLLEFLPLWLGGIASLGGGTWLATMLQPTATEEASYRCHGVLRYALGLLVIVVTAVALVALIFSGIRPLRGLLATILAIELSLGLAAAARALGRRIAPESSPVAQSWLGLAGLILPLATPLGLPVLAIAAPLGLGAWLWRRTENRTL